MKLNQKYHRVATGFFEYSSKLEAYKEQNYSAVFLTPCVFKGVVIRAPGIATEHQKILKNNPRGTYRL